MVQEQPHTFGGRGFLRSSANPESILKALPSILAGDGRGVIDLQGAPSNAKGVIQKEFAIASANSAVSVIGTSKPETCMVFTVYESNSKIAAVAHIDALTIPETIQYVFNHFSPADDRRLEVRFFGATPSSFQLTALLFPQIDRVPGVVCLTADFGSHISDGLCMDAKDGRILLNSNPTDFGTNLSQRFDRAVLPARLALVLGFDAQRSRL